MNKTTVEIPINHLSFSAIKDYLSDRLKFERVYIRLIFNKNTSVALALGTSFHHGIEMYWKAIKEKDPGARGIAEAEAQRKFGTILDIDYGKKLDEAKAKKILENSLASYLDLASDPEYMASTGQIIEAEQTIYANVPNYLTGELYPIPLKVKIDQVFRNGDAEIVGHDAKLESTIGEEEDVSKQLQAAAIYLGLVHQYPGERIARYVVFDETSKHVTPQRLSRRVHVSDTILRQFTCLFGSVLNDLLVHYHSDAYDPMDPTRLPFLPNPFAMFDTEETWADFTEKVSPEVKRETENFIL